MLRKAREKAKEGFHSVQSETKRYLQSRQHRGGGPRGPGHGPRSSRHQPSSASPSFMSFKGVNDNEFEAILNDESDFTNQFDEPHEALGTGPSSIEEEEGIPPASDGNHGTDEDFHADGDSDLFSDPLFSEPKQDVSLPEETHINNADLLFVEDPLGLTVSDDHQENEFAAIIKATDNTAIPNSDAAHHVSGNFVLPSDVLSDSRDVAPLPESVAKAQDPLPPDSPLFSDDVMAGSTNHMEDDRKEESQSNARFIITQPSNESPQQSRKLGADENRDEQLGERQSEEDTIDIHELPKPSTPDLPDIEELEQNLAVSKIESGQDLFSSEESPFSSLASSYEGDKVLGTVTTTATLPHTESTKSGHDESELFQEVVSAVVKEVDGHPMTTTEATPPPPPPQPTNNQQQQPAPALYSLDEELERLLTPKQKLSTAPSHDLSAYGSTVEAGLHQSSSVVVDDPLQAGSHPLMPGRETVNSHLDSGVFEQSGSSSTLKPTPEREGVDSTHEDDLFPIDEDHFKDDDDDSTPVPVRRQLIKGSSNIEISHQSKKVLQNAISAPAIMPPDVSKTPSGSPPLKKNSTGKVAPPRPAISPKLKHRMTQKQSVSSSSIGGHSEDYTARKKLVQPLGQAPQGRDAAVRDRSPVRVETGVDSSAVSSDTIAVRPPAGRRGGSGSPSKQDEKRIPADDLFLEDSVVSPSSDGVEKVPRSTEEQSKLAETESEDEETRNYFIYHFLFAGLLYFYYSLNIFPYLSGFFAGFFVLYLTVGSVFIFYVQTVEKYQTGEGKEDRLLEPSQDFTELMHVDFDNLKVYKVSHSRYEMYVCILVDVHAGIYIYSTGISYP